MAEKDKYGIPIGGNNGPYVAKNWKGLNYTLPWSELMAAIALAGWPKDTWGKAGAVVAAESSRNPFKYNTYKLGHFGLFQVSRSAWPEFFQESKDGGMDWVDPVQNAKKGYEIYKKQGWGAWEGKTDGGYLAYYPAAMAAAADLQKKTGLHGGDEKGYWNSLISNKTNVAILKAINVSAADLAAAAQKGLGEAIAGGAYAAADGTVSAGADAASAINDTFGWMPDLWTTLTTPAIWMRFAYGAAGVALVAGGLFLIVRNRPAVQQAASGLKSVATTVVPGGAAVKAAAAKAGAA